MQRIIVINGPNLNLLGQRKPDIYGKFSLQEIIDKVKVYAENHNIETTFLQSNYEGEIIDAIQKAKDFKGIIINPGGYTHTSVAIRDAIEAMAICTVEVHISNIYERESFRNKSIIAPVCKGQISGLGWYGYIVALRYFVQVGE